MAAAGGRNRTAGLLAPARRIPSVRGLAVATGAVAVLVCAPIACLALIALQGDASTARHVATTILPVALRETALLLAGVAVVVSLAGIGTAWLVTAYRFPGRNLVGAALVLPLAVPPYLVAYVYVELLEPLGPVQASLRAAFGWRSRADYWFPEVRSLPGAILVMGFVLYPYVYLTTRALFAVQSANLIEAARLLGAGPRELFLRVALPLARPAVALGLSLALLETLNDIGATEYLGVRTLTVSIYATWVNRNSLPGAAQIAVAMLAIVALLLVLEHRARGARGFSGSLKRPRPLAPVPLPGWRGALALAACLLPVIVGFAVPAGWLLRHAVARSLSGGVDPAFPALLGATLTLAATATALIVVLGLCVAVAVRLARRRDVSAAARVAALGYAVPGTVLAVGLLWPLAGLDNLVADAWRWLTGASPGLIIMGSGAAVVVAYVIRFLGIAIGSIEAGFARISPRIDDAARTLGRKPGELLREIHMPLSGPALVSAGLLVFVDAMKELPATLLLRPLNLDTLATYVYAQAARGSFEDGALAALTIVGVGLVPVFMLLRAGDRASPPEAAAVEEPSPVTP
jgi:iron(III) transport system permease protein